MKRKQFLMQTLIGSGSIFLFPGVLSSQQSTTTKSSPVIEPLPADKVKEFVIAGHGNLEKVKSMLQEMPTLLYATWDWGGGDFETALEGAGHVGNKQIATYLIELGARTNLFVLTMLGKTQLVKSYLEIWPQYLNARGPHGLSLLHHAQKGGEEAKELQEYFLSKGLKETKMTL